MSSNPITMCGHPLHSQRACGTCHGCRADRARIGHVLSAAQMVVAANENDRSMLPAALEKLQRALDYRTV